MQVRMQAQCQAHGTCALPLPCAPCVCKRMGRQHMGGHCTRWEAHTTHTHTLNPGDWLLPPPLHTPSTHPWHQCLASNLCPMCVQAHGRAAHGWALHKVGGTHPHFTHTLTLTHLPPSLPPGARSRPLLGEHVGVGVPCSLGCSWGACVLRQSPILKKEQAPEHGNRRP